MGRHTFGLVWLLSCLVMLVSCTDSEKEGQTEAPVVTLMPDVSLPLSAGMLVTLEGTGFADDCQVELWRTTVTRAGQDIILVEVTKRTATTITFVVPADVEGVCDVVIKQGGETFTVGQISLTTSPFVGRWQWLESISDSEHEYHSNRFFAIHADGTGWSMQNDGIIDTFGWSADAESAIEIRFTGEHEGETLHLVVKESAGNRMTLQYEADGVTWTEILQRVVSVGGNPNPPVESPEVSTMESRDITDKTAICTGVYLGEQKAGEVGVCYSPTNREPRVADGKVTATLGNDGMFSARLSGLEMDKEYYWRPYVVVEGITYYGSVAAFTTLGVWTVDARHVTFTSAQCAGSASCLADIYKYGICYSPDKAEPTIGDEKKETDISGVDGYGRFEMTLSELKSGKSYHYRAYQLLEDGTVIYGEVKDFVTASCATGSSYPDEDGAVCYGQYIASPEASPVPEEFGIFYGIDNMVKMPATNFESANGAFSVVLSGLEAGKTYQYQAYVTVDGETCFGEVKTFVTKKTIYGTWQRISFVSYDRKAGSGTWMQTPTADNDFIVTYRKDGTCVVVPHGGSEIAGNFSYDETSERLSTTYGGTTEEGTAKVSADKTHLTFTTDIKTEMVDGVMYEHYAVTEWDKIGD